MWSDNKKQEEVCPLSRKLQHWYSYIIIIFIIDAKKASSQLPSRRKINRVNQPIKFSPSGSLSKIGTVRYVSTKVSDLSVSVSAHHVYIAYLAYVRAAPYITGVDYYVLRIVAPFPPHPGIPVIASKRVTFCTLSTKVARSVKAPLNLTHALREYLPSAYGYLPCKYSSLLSYLLYVRGVLVGILGANIAAGCNVEICDNFFCVLKIMTLARAEEGILFRWKKKNC